MIRSIIVFGWLVVASTLRINQRVSFIFGLLTLVFSGVMLILDISGFALRMMTYAYSFFIVGLLAYLRVLKTNEK